MASFNNPKVSNSISSDIAEIRSLLQVLAKQDYTGATNLPSGAKRIAAVTGGVQLQKYNGSSWATIGKLMHSVDQLDGYHASTSAVKNTIPVYNAAAQLVGSITGNAATATKLASARTIDIGGIASADAVAFNGTKGITIPINSINVANEDDTALVGIVSKAHGGTGRTDGAAEDVMVNSLSGTVKAEASGQIGKAVGLGSKNLDSLIVDGFYIGGGSAKTVEMGYPMDTTAAITLRVMTADKYVHQLLSLNSDQYWHRYSSDKGASWNKWVCVGAASDVSFRPIFVSKSGSDLNTGLEADYPVLTINRAMQIAGTLVAKLPNAAIKLCIGEGDWGDVTFNGTPFPLHIYPFSGTAATAYSSSVPVFKTLSFAGNGYYVIRGVVADEIDANSGAFLDMARSFSRFGQLRSRYSATIDVYNSKMEIKSNGSAYDCFRTYHGGRIVVGAVSTCKVVENVTVDTAFIYASACSELMNLEGITFSLASGVKVTGKKYYIAAGANVYYATKAYLDKLPGTVAGSIGLGAVVEGVPYGGGASDEALMADLSWKPVLLQTGGTVTGELVIKPENTRFGVVNGAVTKGTNPSANQYWQIQFADKSGLSSGATRLGCLETKLSTNGDVHTELSAYQNKASASDRSTLTVYRKADGTGYATCPTPPSSASSIEITTAAWVRKVLESYATDADLKKYLPLAGGTMTGTLKVPEKAISRGSTNGILRIWGGDSDATGSSLLLFGKDRAGYRGGFILRAKGDDGQYDLTANTELGSLTWAGKNLVRSINGKSADTNGNIALDNYIVDQWTNGSNEGYVKYANGRVEQWGFISYNAAIGGQYSADMTIPFHIPMPNKYYNIVLTCITGAGPSPCYAYVRNQTSVNSCGIAVFAHNYIGGVQVYWRAVCK